MKPLILSNQPWTTALSSRTLLGVSAMIDGIEKLAIAAEQLKGRRILITSSFSRARDVGHDRHFSTRMTFPMTVEFAAAAFSGANLAFGGKTDGLDSSFAVSLGHVIDFNVLPNGGLEITEHYEKECERLTSIEPVE